MIIVFQGKQWHERVFDIIFSYGFKSEITTLYFSDKDKLDPLCFWSSGFTIDSKKKIQYKTKV